MRLFTSVIASALVAFAATSVSANVVFNATASAPNALNALQVGDLVTINIRLSNDSALDFIAGVGGAVFGYSPSIMQFQSGVAADTSLFCTNTGCTNGVPVTGNDPVTGDPIPLVEGTSPTTGKFVSFVSAIATTARNGNGARDPGFDGVVNGGDTEFRVVFRAGAPGTTTFTIGTSTDSFIGNLIVTSTAPTGGTVDPARQGVNASIQVTVVPEPGTVLLMGLGLAGLAVAGRRF